ncbi:unnamed protein product [Psylliodes chrysocephalus]|uniref:Myb/SANT-like DNA-binding domain-containing protein n=1 Tax=Psylliodes chrysocephalus TaxID=3402493 RepID=A0A9P0CTN4_9CUCU|nr:unnamed protein product [Psylliodes chrysocephala]
MDAFKVFVNGKPIYFQDRRDVLMNMAKDDEYLLDYIHRAVLTNSLAQYGIYNHMSDQITVEREENQEFLNVDNSENECLEMEMDNILHTNTLNNNLNKNVSDHSIMVWTNKAHPSKVDNDATRELIKLRGSHKFKRRLDDKSHNKLQIWIEIAQEMCKAGFEVGSKKEGGVRCRQKWANLQRTYYKYKSNQRSTGAEYLDPPPFFAEIDNILGQKDIATPKYLMHSRCTTNTPTFEKRNNIPTTSNGTQTIDQFEEPCYLSNISETSSETYLHETQKKSIFENVKKTVKCSDKEVILKEISNLVHLTNSHFEEVKNQNAEHHEFIKNAVKTEENQRAAFLKLFSDLVKSVTNKNKRKHSDDESE